MADNPGAGSPTILIVDDEPFIRLALSDYLKECGFLVIEACDGEEAVEVLEALPGVALVVSDVRMPGKLDGVGLARWIGERLPGLPVFLLSGDMGRVYAPNEVHAARFFGKPCDFGLLARTIRETLKA